MAQKLITELRAEINKIKELKKKSFQKIALDMGTLDKYFKNVTLERRKEILEGLEDLAKIILNQLSRRKNIV